MELKMIIREILWRDPDFEGCEWTHSGKDNEYETLEWSDSNTVLKPTLEDLQAKWPAIQSELILSHIRSERNKLLAESDWVVTRASDLGESVPANWQTYRQALRDMTNDISGIQLVPMDEGYWHDIDGIVWPTKPE
jgi:hypothetical protein